MPCWMALILAWAFCTRWPAMITSRRAFLNAIGPIWDGNEVWLVTFGGALFAAFPEAYATIFSAFYIVFMMVLTAPDLPRSGH